MAVQINARVSEVTKAMLERECRATGLKKETLVEEALLHHFRAMQSLPTDVVVKPKLLVQVDAALGLLEQLEGGEPTPALKALMQRHGA